MYAPVTREALPMHAPVTPQAPPVRKKYACQIGMFAMMCAVVALTTTKYQVKPMITPNETTHLFSAPFPEIESLQSLVKKYVTKTVWDKLAGLKTKTAGFTLGGAIAAAVERDDQSVGIVAGDWDCYNVFADVFNPIIRDYHNLVVDPRKRIDLDYTKIVGNIDPRALVHGVRLRTGRNIDGFPLTPGMTQEQRLDLESLFVASFSNLKGDLSGKYYSLKGMTEVIRQQLVDDHFLFMSGDPFLQITGMEKDWPLGRGIFHSNDKTLVIWVQETEHAKIIIRHNDLKAALQKLSDGIKSIADSVQKAGKRFMIDDRYGYIHAMPENLGTGLLVSVTIDLPGWMTEGSDKLKARCAELGLNVRGTRMTGYSSNRYAISNNDTIRESEVELVQRVINGVNALYQEDLRLQVK